VFRDDPEPYNRGLRSRVAVHEESFMPGSFRVPGRHVCLAFPGALLVAAIALPGGLRGADCNGNAVEDAQDISAGTSQDCNGDRIPDECHLLDADCN
jgi:hypothetical protein